MRAHPARIIGAAIVLLAALGCRPRPAASNVALADDIDAIEQALAERGAQLESEGIVVAYRDGGDAEKDKAAVDAAPTTVAPPVAGPTDDTAGAEATEEAPSIPDSTQPSPVQKRASQAPFERDRLTRSSEAEHRCERICDLAQSTCALGDRICTLAARHFGDPRYALACGRAQAQCTAAREHCDGC